MSSTTCSHDEAISQLLARIELLELSMYQKLSSSGSPPSMTLPDPSLPATSPILIPGTVPESPSPDSAPLLQASLVGSTEEKLAHLVERVDSLERAESGLQDKLVENCSNPMLPVVAPPPPTSTSSPSPSPSQSPISTPTSSSVLQPKMSSAPETTLPSITEAPEIDQNTIERMKKQPSVLSTAQQSMKVKKLLSRVEKIPAMVEIINRNRGSIVQGTAHKLTEKGSALRFLVLVDTHLFVGTELAPWTPNNDSPLDHKTYDLYNLKNMRLISHPTLEEDCLEMKTTNEGLRFAFQSAEQKVFWKEQIEQAMPEIRIEERFLKPVFVRQIDSDECMMAGRIAGRCSAKQPEINCHSCGILICRNCSGKAPVPSFQFASERVCPVCYDEMEKLATNQKDGEFEYFPKELLKWKKNRLVAKVGPNQKRVLVDDLFLPPKNLTYTKRSFDNRIRNKLVAGAALVKEEQGFGKPKYLWVTVDGGFLHIGIFNTKYSVNPVSRIQVHTSLACIVSKCVDEQFYIGIKDNKKDKLVLEFLVPNRSIHCSWEIAIGSKVGEGALDSKPFTS